MITARHAEERGRFDHGWLDTRHTFSFAGYHDPQFMGYRTLRVINDDRISPGAGFPTHPHEDMEIITYVISGALIHEDSLNNGSVIRPGDAQRMTAGHGIEHSEYNYSWEEPLRLLQIWIVPDTAGLTPSYEQHHFEDVTRRNRLALMASGDGRGESIQIHQNVDLYSSLLEPGVSVAQNLNHGQGAWVQVAEGSINANGMFLKEGDGAVIEGVSRAVITGETDANILLFVFD